MASSARGFPWLALVGCAIILSVSVILGQKLTISRTGQAWQNDAASLSSLSPYEVETCIIDRRTAFEQSNAPVVLSNSPIEHPEIPKLASANSSAWEQWEFDGTSDSADSSILINFTRDPSYHFFGQGNLRVELFLMLDGRSVLQDLDFVDNSTFVTCSDYVSGIWVAAGRTYRFDVPTDMTGATVRWTTGRHRGTVRFDSAAAAHLASGPLWPSLESTVHLAPGFSVAQPIPGGAMQAVYRTPSGSKTFSGSGGHTRFWATDGWFKFAGGFDQIRAVVGPYVLTYWQHQSRDDNLMGREIYSAHLFKHGELLMSTNIGDSASDAADHVLFRSDLSGNVTGSSAPDVTGRTIEFVSPQRQKRWRFHADHRHRQFDMAIGNGKGISGFAATFRGGEVGARAETGSGFVEHTVFPTEFKQWQIWAIYISHSLTNWWKQMRTLLL